MTGAASINVVSRQVYQVEGKVLHPHILLSTHMGGCVGGGEGVWVEVRVCGWEGRVWGRVCECVWVEGRVWGEGVWVEGRVCGWKGGCGWMEGRVWVGRGEGVGGGEGVRGEYVGGGYVG